MSRPLSLRWCGAEQSHLTHIYAEPSGPIGWSVQCPGFVGKNSVPLGTVCVRLDGLADQIADLLIHDARNRGLNATVDDCKYFAAGTVALLQSLAVQ